jgi:hypothetical protein
MFIGDTCDLAALDAEDGCRVADDIEDHGLKRDERSGVLRIEENRLASGRCSVGVSYGFCTTGLWRWAGDWSSGGSGLIFGGALG